MFGGCKVLVTGASGFIGTALCRRLKADGAVVAAIARSLTGDNAFARWWACDVSRLDDVHAVFDAFRPEIVFHLASRVTGSRALDEVIPTLTANLIGTVNVLISSIQHNVARVISIGSLQEPDITVPAFPNSPYAAAKLGASAYARLFARVYSTPVTIVRPFMVYGPGQLDFTKLLPSVSAKLLKGGIAELTSGKQEFDWVYVDDVIDALMAVGSTRGLDGVEVDVGTGTLTSVMDVVKQLASHLGYRDSLRFGVLPDRGLEPTRCADIQTTDRLLHWRPKVLVSEGLSQTAEWYTRYFENSSHRP